MKWFIFVLIIITLFVIFSQIGIYQNNNVDLGNVLKVGNAVLNIDIADTDVERTQGLSGKEELKKDTGMLFVFEKAGYYGIWMKDMKFSIDIAWLDKDKKIIYIENNISPETYPKVFNSTIPSLYVLEVSAEFLGENNVKIGDFVAF